MINNLNFRGIARTTVLLLAMTAVGCSSYGKKKSSNSGGDEEESTAEVEETTTTTEQNTDGQTTVNGDTLDSLDGARAKVRNYNQFYSTYTSLLEIPENDQILTTFFVPIKTNLPTLTDASGFLGSHQLALVKLGSKVCERSWDLNTSPEARARIFGVEETAVLADAFDSASAHILARTLISRLWGQEFDGVTDDDVNVQTVVQLITDSVAAMTEFDAASTAVTLTDAMKIKYGVVGACTSVITSAGVSFYGQ